MSLDHPRKSPEVISLADVRRRLEAEKEDAVAPIRMAFMEELGELFEDYLEEVRAATNDDPDKAVEELMAACSTVLALAAEEYFEDVEAQVDFIDTVAEIASELVSEESAQGELFEDED